MSERAATPPRRRPGVLITGTSSGLGRACALHLEAQGWEVFAGVRSERDAQALTGLARGHITPVRLDVTQPESIASALAFVAARAQGRLEALVNNAGLALGGPLETTPQAEVERLFQVNVLGVFAVTRSFLPLLRQARGRIVFMGSVSGLIGLPGLTAYAASKFAVEGLADALRVELAPLGVKVMVIEPGKIDTPIWEKAQRALGGQRARAGEALPAGYAPLVEYLERYARDAPASPLAGVVRAVDRALCADRPPARQVIGRAARARLLMGRLPVRWRDALILRKVRGRP